MNTLPLPRLNKFGLAAPCADDVRTSVAAVDYRNFTSNWKTACANAGVPFHSNLLDLDQLHSLATALSEIGGPVSLMGRALEIRVASYETLAKQDDDEIRSADSGRRVFENLIRTRIPDGEVIREIDSLDLFSTENNLKLDDAARRAATALQAEIGLVNIMLGGVQSIVGQYGPIEWMAQTQGSPIEWAFCATTIRREEPYVVADLNADTMQRHNPFTKYTAASSYAGVPLMTSTGMTIGSICVIGADVREFNDNDVALLTEIADAVVADLELVRTSRQKIRAFK